MISHTCMPNEALRSIEGNSWVLEVTITFIFSINFFLMIPETFQDRPTMIFEEEKKAQIFQLIDILYYVETNYKSTFCCHAQCFMGDCSPFPHKNKQTNKQTKKNI